jgi:hypothetical protein
MSDRRRTSRSSIGTRAALFATVVSVALAGCVGIPAGGSVMPGNLVTEDETFPFAALPSGPQADSTQQEILTDFIQAATSPERDYEIARQFLTPGADEQWVPNASVLIREGSGTTLTISETTVEYSVATKASIDALGLYVEDRVQATQRRQYSFEQVDGQWRISALDNGIVLSRDNFEAAFDEHALYFFDPSYRYLIPDVRWFPTRSDVPTRIVSALVGGQASWMQGGATLSAFPQGTRVSAVDVVSGRATVDLSEDVAGLNNIDKARIQQQLESSLGTVSVNTVSLTVRGVPLAVSDPSASNATVTPPVDSEALIRREDEFGFATDDTFSTINDLSAKIVGVDAAAVTLARGQNSAAVLGQGGAYLVTVGDPNPILVDSRGGLVAPSIDTWKYVWSVPADNAAALRAVGADQVVHEISSTLPVDAEVVSMDVSRDGGRVLLYLNTDAGPKLFVAAVLRRDGVPSGLGELIGLPVSADAPIDASWVDDRSVASLAMVEGHQTVTLFQIGGPSETLGRADGGVALVGGNGTEQIRVLTDTGTILQRRASGWQNSLLTADVLATQQ